MESESKPEITPAPAHFAQGDTSRGQDLKWRITACLRDRLPNLQGIRLTVIGNTVAIRGPVASVQEKRLCIECCRHVPGVVRVVDELLVAEEKPTCRNGEGP